MHDYYVHPCIFFHSFFFFFTGCRFVNALMCTRRKSVEQHDWQRVSSRLAYNICKRCKPNRAPKATPQRIYFGFNNTASSRCKIVIIRCAFGLAITNLPMWTSLTRNFGCDGHGKGAVLTAYSSLVTAGAKLLLHKCFFYFLTNSALYLYIDEWTFIKNPPVIVNTGW